MKKILPILVALVVFSSCKHDEEPTACFDFSTLETRGKRFIPFGEQERDVEQEQPWNSIPRDAAFDAEGNYVEDHSRKASSLVLTDLARGIVGSLSTNKVQQVSGTYMSTDVYGAPIKLSGAVYYPTSGRIRNMIVCSHYTVAANYEVPSQTFPIEAALAALGYLVVMPDYIGYGVSQNKVHPYLQADVTSRNVIDMALGVRAFIVERKLQVESEEVLLVGYSQGGATSMWVQYFMETDPEYEGLFKIKKNYCGGGPYNVARTYDYCVKLDETGIPYAVPMIILGMSEGMAEPLNIETFFQEPLLSNYKEWFNTKKYNGIQITKLIGVNKLSQILTPAGRDRYNGETLSLYRELQKNSLPDTYTPKAPIYMFHSMDDQTVPFINAQVTRYNFKYGHDIASYFERKAGPIEYDFDHYGNHQSGCIKFYLKLFQMLK